MIRCRHNLSSSFLKAASFHHSSTSPWTVLQELPDGSLETFREQAFKPAVPALLPRLQFYGLPAVTRWFTGGSRDVNAPMSIQNELLSRFGEAMVPLEFTTASEGSETVFQRAEAPLQLYLEWAKNATAATRDRLYMAQASLATLPKAMRDDLPIPGFVAKAGKGDVYDSNLWMGIPPTYTPLHRDPNPNLFVQLAGHKVVRMMSPNAGNVVFGHVQNALGRSGSSAFRGEEMMRGEEKRLLEDQVWGGPSLDSETRHHRYEVSLFSGDGIFIPQGWWHSIKGIDEGVTASVNWWFR